MTLEELGERLRNIDGALCPEPGGFWSIIDITSEQTFCGFENTIEAALIAAENQFKEYTMGRK